MICRLLHGDALEMLRTLPAESVQCVVTSPPYWNLRDYNIVGQIGLERTLEEYIAALVGVFAEVRRVVHPTGTVWLNIGDSYAGGGCGARDAERWPKQQRNDHMPKHAKRQSSLKDKDLCMVPARLALALQDAGWWLRSEIIWHKPNPMPESVSDRPTKAHEQLYLLAKSARYYYDAAAIKDPASGTAHARGTGVNPKAAQGTRDAAGGGPRSKQNSYFSAAVHEVVEERNKRSVWTIPLGSYPGAHFATFPEALVQPCILAGSRPGDVVLDPFCGSSTVGAVALAHGRQYIGIDLNPAYLELSRERLGLFAPELEVPA